MGIQEKGLCTSPREAQHSRAYPGGRGGGEMPKGMSVEELILAVGKAAHCQDHRRANHAPHQLQHLESVQDPAPRLDSTADPSRGHR